MCILPLALLRAGGAGTCVAVPQPRHGHPSPWREALSEISLKCFCKYFLGRPWERRPSSPLSR